MMALAEDLGCDAVEWAVADIVPGHTDGSALRPEQAAAVRGALDGLLSRAAWRSPRPLALPALLSRLDALARGEPIDRAAVHAMPCFAGWTYSRVMADGRVIPCLKSHRLPSGNLHDQRFRAIWEGSRQAAFRDAARSFAKSDPLLQHVGNDERAACGCETGCDNLAENKAAWGRLRAKSGVERAALRGIVSLPEALRARLT
jgi:MoaA/NifB/PqqE/SkfB family radical SAM enzyme